MPYNKLARPGKPSLLGLYCRILTLSMHGYFCMGHARYVLPLPEANVPQYVILYVGVYT